MVCLNPLRYIPNTIEQQESMLKEMGKSSIDELFSDIPEKLKLKRGLNIPQAMSEMELIKHMENLASKNVNTDEYSCFLGAGVYDHYIPSLIKHILMRGEFYTAYTPYQPEISQGTLQAIFEYQTMICELTGMDVSNASMYDGATATAEAMLLACNAKRKNKILISEGVHPEYKNVVKTYAAFNNIEVEEIGINNGITDLDKLTNKIKKESAGFIVQSPNFFGAIENLDNIGIITEKSGGLFIVISDPISLSILKAPADFGADIVIGEGQVLGNPLSFGGPHLGFFAVNKDLMRKMPGRVVGETVDVSGNRGFVLTMQTREQHIRRERATSNICTNQALNALAAAIFLSTLGKKGLQEIANLCIQKTHYTYDKLLKTGEFEPLFTAPFFKEFTVKLKDEGSIKRLNDGLLKENIIGGLDLSRFYEDYNGAWLLAVTEKRTKEEIDNFVKKTEDLIEKERNLLAKVEGRVEHEK